jgi:hypothetical protein
MAEKKPGGPAKPEPAPVLGAAGESSDPVVHQLLAEREIAISNGDEDAVKAVNGRLAELGVK